MEKRHKEIITQQFRNEIQGKILKILFIPDEFELMDERLIEILQEKITS